MIVVMGGLPEDIQDDGGFDLAGLQRELEGLGGGLDWVLMSAILSKCGLYRYSLARKWSNDPVMGFIMLNPSTADGQDDDATIRRCMGFARRELCGAIVVVNLFSLRATSPFEMVRGGDPLRGPDHDEYVGKALASVSGPLVCAWGAHSSVPLGVAAMARAIRAAGLEDRAMCLGLTRAGHPRHPLYLRVDTPLQPFTLPAAEGLQP